MKYFFLILFIILAKKWYILNKEKQKKLFQLFYIIKSLEFFIFV